MNTDNLRYAGFFSRAAAMVVDGAILLPLTVLFIWADLQSRLFEFYFFVPGVVIDLLFSVYLVKRFGGTPGKLLLGMRIRKVNGDPVGYREAVLRYAPDFILGLLASAALLMASFHMTDSEYLALPYIERLQRLIALAPAWYFLVRNMQNVWSWGELLVLLTNRKKRALHDFIAGTVVVEVDTLPKDAPMAAVAAHG